MVTLALERADMCRVGTMSCRYSARQNFNKTIEKCTEIGALHNFVSPNCLCTAYTAFCKRARVSCFLGVPLIYAHLLSLARFQNGPQAGDDAYAEGDVGIHSVVLCVSDRDRCVGHHEPYDCGDAGEVQSCQFCRWSSLESGKGAGDFMEYSTGTAPGATDRQHCNIF